MPSENTSPTPPQISTYPSSVCREGEDLAVASARGMVDLDHDPAISVQNVFTRRLDASFGHEFFKKLNSLPTTSGH